jgi:hypothetical protein
MQIDKVVRLKIVRAIGKQVYSDVTRAITIDIKGA